MKMNDFENEIRQYNLERIKSIGYQVLQKGIVDDISYQIKPESSKNDERLSVSKTGDEIKQKLREELNNISTLKQSMFIKMVSISKEIGTLPSKELDSYRAEDWGGKVTIPLTYCYSQIYDPIDNADVPEAKQMREYNSLARKYFDKSIEEKKINTIINAIPDKKKFSLSIDIASKMGF